MTLSITTFRASLLTAGRSPLCHWLKGFGMSWPLSSKAPEDLKVWRVDPPPPAIDSRCRSRSPHFKTRNCRVDSCRRNKDQNNWYKFSIPWIIYQNSRKYHLSSVCLMVEHGDYGTNHVNQKINWDRWIFSRRKLCSRQFSKLKLVSDVRSSKSFELIGSPRCESCASRVTQA